MVFFIFTHKFNFKESTIIWNVICCGLVEFFRRFGEKYCLQFQDREVSQAKNWQEESKDFCLLLSSCLRAIGFDSQYGQQIFLFSVTSMVPRIGYDRFLPSPLQFIFHYSCHHSTPHVGPVLRITSFKKSLKIKNTGQVS